MEIDFSDNLSEKENKNRGKRGGKNQKHQTKKYWEMVRGRGQGRRRRRGKGRQYFRNSWETWEHYENYGWGRGGRGGGGGEK
ncbi:hypothetical protein PUN28_020903 [Cardiocondyla obscurior]|uniref:Uncharacterized protein n=1 Tax=Cardiocondyla obscurior TaxID=286306 RepID=A0AAW2E7K5_9HYME